MRRLLLLLCCLCFTMPASAATTFKSKHILYQLQGVKPKTVSSQYGAIIMDYSKDGSGEQRYTKAEIALLKRKRVTPIAYLSIGEAETYRSYWPSVKGKAFIGKENPDWDGNYKVRYWDQAWQKTMMRYIDDIAAAGFSGLYLDIIDAYEYWGNAPHEHRLATDPKSEADAARRMIDFVVSIQAHAARYKMIVIPQNGEAIVQYDKDGRYMKAIAGIGVEDLWYNETEKQPKADTAYRLSWLTKMKQAGKFVFSVDYVNHDDGKSDARIRDYMAKCQQYGFYYFVGHSDRALDRP